MNNTKNEIILIICMEPPDAKLPPVLNFTKIANDLSYKVILITSKIGQLEKQNLRHSGIQCFELHIKNKGKSRLKFINKINTCLTWLKFRSRAWKIIKSFNNKSPVLWVASVDTAIALGRRLRRYRFIFHSHELLDRAFLRKRFANYYSQLAQCVVVPSDFRSEIMQASFHLRGKPVVLPNKTFNHPLKRRINISTDLDAKSLHFLKNKKVILYQGIINRSRPLRQIADGIQILGEEWHFVLMGKVLDDSLKLIRERCHNVTVIPHINAPTHLEITSYAHIGIVTYEGSSLNNIFCAPNKIWEYSGFRVPMICSDIAGLRYTIGESKSGICVDITNPSHVADALLEIDENYDSFSNNASIFFNSVDEKAIVLNILSSQYKIK